MSQVAYRLLSPPDVEEWFDDAAGADAAVAQRLGLTPDQIVLLRRRITIDPIVVRRNSARWRSREVWSIRSDTGTIRVFEMVWIDETLYDH